MKYLFCVVAFCRVISFLHWLIALIWIGFYFLKNKRCVEIEQNHDFK